jgi:hypothetical protein
MSWSAAPAASNGPSPSCAPSSSTTLVNHARSRGYAPPLGFAGVFSLLEPAVAGLLPEGTLGVSPYALGEGPEGDPLRAAVQGEVGAAVVHGWVTAQSLVAALGASSGTRASLAHALADLDGFDSGLAPPYATRPGSNARTPDGVLYRVQGGKFARVSGFLAGD